MAASLYTNTFRPHLARVIRDLICINSRQNNVCPARLSECYKPIGLLFHPINIWFWVKLSLFQLQSGWSATLMNGVLGHLCAHNISQTAGGTFPRKHKTFVQHLYNVGPTSKTNVGPTLYKCCTNVLRLLGLRLVRWMRWHALPSRHRMRNSSPGGLGPNYSYMVKDLIKIGLCSNW